MAYHLILKGELADIFIKYCNNNCKNKASVCRTAIKEYLIKNKVLIDMKGGIEKDGKRRE
jgi:hypothetical protein